jgi:hypothetical protein
MDVQGVSLSAASSMDVWRGVYVFLSTNSSMEGINKNVDAGTSPVPE